MIKLTPKPNNNQNTPVTKIKRPKYPPNIKNDEKTHETQKMTKIPPKPKNDQNTPKTQQKIYQNTSEPLKMAKITLNPKN